MTKWSFHDNPSLANTWLNRTVTALKMATHWKNIRHWLQDNLCGSAPSANFGKTSCSKMVAILPVMHMLPESFLGKEHFKVPPDHRGHSTPGMITLKSIALMTPLMTIGHPSHSLFELTLCQLLWVRYSNMAMDHSKFSPDFPIQTSSCVGHFPAIRLAGEVKMRSSRLLPLRCGKSAGNLGEIRTAAAISLAFSSFEWLWSHQLPRLFAICSPTKTGGQHPFETGNEPTLYLDEIRTQPLDDQPRLAKHQ